MSSLAVTQFHRAALTIDLTHEDDGDDPVTISKIIIDLTQEDEAPNRNSSLGRANGISFMSLPLEIRLEIYNLNFTEMTLACYADKVDDSMEDDDLDSWEPVCLPISFREYQSSRNVLFTSKAIRAEALPLFKSKFTGFEDSFSIDLRVMQLRGSWDYVTEIHLSPIVRNSIRYLFSPGLEANINYDFPNVKQIVFCTKRSWLGFYEWDEIDNVESNIDIMESFCDELVDEIINTHNPGLSDIIDRSVRALHPDPSMTVSLRVDLPDYMQSPIQYCDLAQLHQQRMQEGRL